MHADGETFTMAPLLMTRRSLSTQHQALPVHVRARVVKAAAEAASSSGDQVRERVADVIKQCLNAHGGSFDLRRSDTRT